VYAEEKVKVIDDAGLESISGGGHDKSFWQQYEAELA